VSWTIGVRGTAGAVKGLFPAITSISALGPTQTPIQGVQGNGAGT
jgi:hypothetical protein